jgi:RNA polymerase sigma-32 factor
VAAAVLSFASHDNLSRYLKDVQLFPMLSAEEELDLARRWRDRQDRKAADKLVTSHLRLVVKIAMGYRGYGLPLSELISEGNAGMIQAVKRFDPDRGVRLATYAMWWIRAAMKQHILHNCSLVKMGTTTAQKRLFFNLRRLKGRLHAFHDGDLEPDEVTKIARILDVPDSEVISMNRRLAGPDHSLNTPMHDDSQDEWQARLVDETETQEIGLARREELNYRRALLAKAWNVLNVRERHIMTERWLTDDRATLGDLSLQYGVSCERVRQIETRAFEKLRKAIKAEMVSRTASGSAMAA